MFWIHTENKGKMPSSSYVLRRWEKKERGGERKQRDKGRKIVKYKETLKRSGEKHSELPKQMYSNTLFDTYSLRTLWLLLRANWS